MIISCTSTPSSQAPAASSAAPAPASTTAAAPQVFKWKGQYSFPTVTPYGPFNQKNSGLNAMPTLWTDWLTSATSGRVQIEWSEPGAIFPITDADLAVGKGTVQIAETSGAYYRGRFPEGDIETGGLFFWNTEDEFYDAYYNWGLFDALQKLYAAKNCVFYPVSGDSATGMGVNFDAPNPAAVKGKKVRAVGVQGDYVAMLGGSPVMTPLGEIYQAMKLGTVDGWMAAVALFEANKFKECTKGWVPDPRVATVPMNMLINKDAFNALPKDLQDIIQGGARYAGFASKVTWRNQNDWALENAQKLFGVKVWNWTPAEQAAIKAQAIKEIWPKIENANDNCKMLMQIFYKQQKAWGRMQ